MSSDLQVSDAGFSAWAVAGVTRRKDPSGVSLGLLPVWSSFLSGINVHVRSFAACRNRFSGKVQNHHRNPDQDFSDSRHPSSFYPG